MLESHRLQEMTDWISAYFGGVAIVPERASVDASFRSYWRVKHNEQSYIVMDAPPEKEDVRPWVKVAERLREAGLNAPDVLSTNIKQGFLLISDLGVRTYLAELNEHTVDDLYKDAIDAIFHMQIKVSQGELAAYEESRLRSELELCPTWFIQRHLGYDLKCAEWDIIESAFRILLNSAQQQPQAFVHRDFHSRNLLITDLNNPGIIDFQDAVIGPITYDLVSLLRDCYIEWPDFMVEKWVEDYRRRLLVAKIAHVDSATFQRWFDLMGLQRHIKVLGIFCRLWYRDGKSQYLHNLPLVVKYTLSVGKRYPELSDFVELLKRAVGEKKLIQAA